MMVEGYHRDAKTGEVTWQGSLGSEIRHWKERALSAEAQLRDSVDPRIRELEKEIVELKEKLKPFERMTTKEWKEGIQADERAYLVRLGKVKP